MSNVYQRIVKEESLNKPLSDFTQQELVYYISKYYSGDKIGALNILYYNGEIGEVLWMQTKIIMEAFKDVKR